MKSTLFALVASAAQLVAATKPNILFILTDDQDWYVSQRKFEQKEQNSKSKTLGTCNRFSTCLCCKNICFTKALSTPTTTALSPCAALPV